jgi:glyoxylase-like metal-dependent hydrolase (beta-lactamase superfamily II)
MPSGALERHPDANDPDSALAQQQIVVGSRRILALSDGVVVIPPTFIGTAQRPTAAHDVLHGSDGRAPLPIGCFLIPGEQNVLIDAGYGNHDHGGRGALVGGRLPTALRENGFSVSDIDMIALTHLHLDHVGWLANGHGQPTFGNAQVLIGRADWAYFVDGEDADLPLTPEVRAVLVDLFSRGRVTLLDGDAPVTASVNRLGAAGHTPGHAVFVVSDGEERALLLGDALYCPQQLSEPDWAALTDVDPILAERTRRTILGDLESRGGTAVGCHFPGLRASRVLSRSAGRPAQGEGPQR